MQKKKQHLKNPWITREIIHAKRRANRLRKANKNNPKPSTTLKLKSAVMHFKQKLKDSKQYYYSVTLASFLKNNPQRFWKHLRSTEQTTTKLTEEEKVQQQTNITISSNQSSRKTMVHSPSSTILYVSA